MSLLIIHPGGKAGSWEKRIRAMLPEAEVRVWPDTGPAEAVDYVLTWNHPPGEFRKFPRLKCIASMGAGVDHILRDEDLPPGVPVTRIVDPAMAQSMCEYVVMHVLNHCRDTFTHRRSQDRRRWAPRIPKLARNECVGIMGLGHLGRRTAEGLGHLGFRVVGWRRTHREEGAAATFAGRGELGAFLEEVSILVCMLPLTRHTRGILNRETFAALRPGAFVVNVARGEHLVEADLFEALDAGVLSGACLDVFRTEPLPPEHPFWDRPEIVVTPHVSSLTNPADVVPQVVENYRRVRQGLPPLNAVDRDRGY